MSLFKRNKTGKTLFAGLTACGFLLGGSFNASAAGETEKTFPIEPKVYDEDVMPLKPSKPNQQENMEPALYHENDEKQANDALTSFVNETKRRPNILVYIMDDVGWGDLGCYGGGEALGAPTPNMDQLAQDGLRLTSTYSQPSSSPTRATIMTGRLPVRHGIFRPPMYGQQNGLNNEITLPQLLQGISKTRDTAPYKTVAVGKWHVGESTESQPQNVGFDEFYGFLSVSDMYTEWRDENFNPEIALSLQRTDMIRSLDFEKHLIYAAGKNSELNYVEKYDAEGHKIISKPAKECQNDTCAAIEIDIARSRNLDTEFTQFASDYILKHKKETPDQPFFMYFGTRGAHFDNYPPDEFKGRSSSKHPYRDTIMELDKHLGSLVAALDKAGELENTIIFITSDNGPEMETWPDAGYTPFRGAKGSFFEGGVRVPGIFYWKNHITGGRVSDGLFDMADLLPTFSKIAGVKELPKDRFIDGIDQTSFLLAPEGQSNRRAIYYWYESQLAAIRLAEIKEHFLIFNDRPHDVVNNGGFSGSTSDGARLFNLYLDPKEERSYLIRKTVYNSIFEGLANVHMKTVVCDPKSTKSNSELCKKMSPEKK